MTYWMGDKCITITKDPFHKRKGLYVGNRYMIQRLATFNSDEDAEEFDAVLTEFFEPLLRQQKEVKQDG